MLLVACVVLGAVILGYIAGGRLRGFEGAHLRWWPLALIGLAMQVAPVPDLGGDGEDLVSLGLLIGSYLPLLAFAVANLRQPGFWLVTAGLAMNLLVISVNMGMPVTREAVVASGQEDVLATLEEDRGSKHHLADREEDILLFLADVIPVGRPFQQVVSGGDLVLYAGVGWFVFGTMRAARGRGGRLVGFGSPTPEPGGPSGTSQASGSSPASSSAPAPGPSAGAPSVSTAPSAAARSAPEPAEPDRPPPQPPPEAPGATRSGTAP
jgi:uncharacterized protein DUF5317